MMSCSRSEIARGIPLLIFCGLLLPIAGCTRPAQSSGAMTSYSGNTSQASDKAQLFTVPQEQLPHLQIVTIAPTSIPRSLRLTGAVAFNAFDTTPVISQIGGPVSRSLATIPSI